jgi:lipid-A-disaccharide synthase-like uncharacterized protein
MDLESYFARLLGSFDQWLVLGLIGQSMFFMRFAVQWVSSERARRSIIPVAFWYFSMAGGILVFAYGVHRADLVLILGQSAGIGIYTRNLYLIWKERRAAGLRRAPIIEVDRAVAPAPID